MWGDTNSRPASSCSRGYCPATRNLPISKIWRRPPHRNLLSVKSVCAHVRNLSRWWFSDRAELGSPVSTTMYLFWCSAVSQVGSNVASIFRVIGPLLLSLIRLANFLVTCLHNSNASHPIYSSWRWKQFILPTCLIYLQSYALSQSKIPKFKFTV
jgi:hypothetical protein